MLRGFDVVDHDHLSALQPGRRPEAIERVAPGQAGTPLDVIVGAQDRDAFVLEDFAVIHAIDPQVLADQAARGPLQVVGVVTGADRVGEPQQEHFAAAARASSASARLRSSMSMLRPTHR